MNVAKKFIALIMLLTMIFSLSLTAAATDDICPPEDEQRIWDYLVQLTGNPMAAAGIMGNLYYESHLLSEATEDSWKSKTGFTNRTYTEQSDNGSYHNFSDDCCGYGIAQWTYSKRKLRLLELADAQGCSVGSLELQLHLLGEELEQFNMLYRLSNTASIRFASDYFLLNFENPNLKNEAVQAKRAQKGQYYYDKYISSTILPVEPTQAQIDVAQIAKESDKYGISVEKGLCHAWAAAVYKEAGYSIFSADSTDKNDADLTVSTDLENIPVGAVIYGRPEKNHMHVGIYLGDGDVCHHTGTVRIDTLSDWISMYNGFCWGWPGGINLSEITD